MNMNLNKTVSKIVNDDINKKLLELLGKNSEIYLVGGYIRDCLLGRECWDKDFVIIGESANDYAQKIADFFKGYLVLLDKEFDIARVVLPDKKHTFDFAGCIGKDIFEDLQRRDFTINALAFDLKKQGGIIDIFDGTGDLTRKIIKSPNVENLTDDPLRMLRAFRHSSGLGFQIEEKTLDFISKNKHLIQNMPCERINTELTKLFEGNFASSTLNLMKTLFFLDEIIPEIEPERNIPKNLHHHLTLIDHSIETIRQIELKIKELPPWVGEHFNREFSPNIKVISLLKFAALLHDIGKPLTWSIDEEGRHRFIKHEEVGSELAPPILKRLKYGKHAIKYVTALIKNHLYPSQLLKCSQSECKEKICGDFSYISEKSILKMFRKLGDMTPDVIILAMADRLSARGPEITQEVVDKNLSGLMFLLEKYKEIKDKDISIPKLLSGIEIMKILKIHPGPELGKIIAALKVQQLAGEINTKEEAENFVRDFYAENL